MAVADPAWSRDAETASAATRCAGSGFDGTLERVDDRAMLRFAGGIDLRLTDIRLAEGEPGGRGRAFLASLAGKGLRGRAMPGDRWGVRAVASLSADGIDVADLLVAEGYAVVDPGEADTLCEPRLLSVEQTARERRLGVWRDTRVTDGNDPAAVAAAVGRFAVIEGLVVSVGERASRTYINLGRASSGALTVTLTKRRWADWRRGHAVMADNLRGRRVRVRGTVEQWRSPMLEVFAPGILEIVGGASGGQSRP